MCSADFLTLLALTPALLETLSGNFWNNNVWSSVSWAHDLVGLILDWSQLFMLFVISSSSTPYPLFGPQLSKVSSFAFGVSRRQSSQVGPLSQVSTLPDHLLAIGPHLLPARLLWAPVRSPGLTCTTSLLLLDVNLPFVLNGPFSFGLSLWGAAGLMISKSRTAVYFLLWVVLGYISKPWAVSGGGAWPWGKRASGCRVAPGQQADPGRPAQGGLRLQGRVPCPPQGPPAVF